MSRPQAPYPVVDVHSHLYVPSYVEYLRARETPPYVRRVDGHDQFMLFPGDHGVTMGDEFTSVAAKLAYMDVAGIEHSILSLGNPWLNLESGSQTVALAASINEELAAAALHGGPRLSAMGVLPNHDVASALASVRDMARSRRLVGIVTGTRICGHDLDDPNLAPLWQEIAASGLPVLVHPLTGLGADSMSGYGQALTLALSFPFETTAAISRMMLAGVFETYPDLQIIAAHGAGTLSYLYGRLRRAIEVDEAAGSLAATLPAGLYADSILFSGKALRQCLDVFGADHVMFGSDHPFPIADARAGQEDIAAVTHDRPDARAAVLAGNARRLYRLPI